MSAYVETRKSDQCRCPVCHEDPQDQGLGETMAQAWLRERRDDPTHDENECRMEFIEMFGFAVLTMSAVDFLRPYGPLLEVGAGSGYWSQELIEAGIDTVATDPKPWHNKRGRGFDAWAPIKRLKAQDAIATYPDRNLLICWPDNLHLDPSDWPYQAVKAFQGEHLVLVGEDSAGCTGTPKMFAFLEREYQPHDLHYIPRFTGIHDRLEVWKRK